MGLKQAAPHERAQRRRLKRADEPRLVDGGIGQQHRFEALLDMREETPSLSCATDRVFASKDLICPTHSSLKTRIGSARLSERRRQNARNPSPRRGWRSSSTRGALPVAAHHRRDQMGFRGKIIVDGADRHRARLGHFANPQAGQALALREGVGRVEDLIPADGRSVSHGTTLPAPSGAYRTEGALARRRTPKTMRCKHGETQARRRRRACEPRSF